MSELGLQLARDIKSRAAREGFEAAGIARLTDDQVLAERLARFIELGRHGDMGWMAETQQRRARPLTLWPEAKSAVMLALRYGDGSDPRAATAARDRAAISIYAQGADYHDVIKPKLKRLAQGLAQVAGAEVKVFVDTAPLMEKPLAAKAGLGWQGKHTNLLSRQLGSWFFLGAILTTAELAPDMPDTDHCGSCQRCLSACPTAAFPAPYQLDARRCLSYLTIEHKGHIDRQFRTALGNRVYGCDDCLAVCPWNKFAQAGRENRLAAREAAKNPPLAELLSLDDGAFRTRFAGSPIKRTGRDRFLRNVLIATGNSRDAGLVPAISRLAADTSPLVRAMAVWALAQLLGRDGFADMRRRLEPNETDAAVRSEWRLGQGTELVE